MQHHIPRVCGRMMNSEERTIRSLFHWPNLKVDVQKLVKECVICQKCKSDLGGLLQPQSIWEDIAMDYVEGLPSSKGNNTTLVMYPLID